MILSRDLIGNLIRNLKVMNYFNLINKSKKYLRRKLLFKYFSKKRAKLRNSYLSDSLLKQFFRHKINYDKLRETFFNTALFSYCNKSEEKKIKEILNFNCSKEIKQYIRHADEILKKNYQIFEEICNFDSKLNWHYGFSKNYNWKLEKSEKINLYPKNEEVDVKYVWELNRHQFLPYLGFAYFITKEEKYANEFKLIIIDWIKNNPPLYGINWYSGLEISIRLISWILSLLFFRNSKEINNNDFFKRIFNSMIQHFYFLRYFYDHRSFNHAVGEIFGLRLFSKIFEEIKPFKKLEKKFFKKFKVQILLQTRNDGTNIEQSIHYHVFVLEFFSLFMIINNFKIEKNLQYLIEKMFNYLLHAIKPNGKLPLIGDSDDGKVLLLTNYKKKDFNDLINLGTILFQQPELKYISKGISPISILLLGIKGFNTYNKLKMKEPLKTFEYFNDAGYYILRNNWTNNANYIFIDYGRFGPQMAPHSHGGITNFIFSLKGKDIIVDSGTFSYNRSWSERRYFRSSKAHNVLTINQKNQAKDIYWFDWENKPMVKRMVKASNSQIRFTCFHNGYKGFIVKRVIILKRELNDILIEDAVIPTKLNLKRKERDIDIYFHFNHEVEIKIENNNAIINNDLLFKVFSKKYFHMSVQNSYFSPKYGIKFKNKVLKIHLKDLFKNKEEVQITTNISQIT